MSEADELSIAYAAAHPREAVRVLEALPAEETAAFAAELDPRLAASLLKQAAPAYAARVLERLDEAQAAALCQALGPQAAAVVLQCLGAEGQARLLARLPLGTALAVRLVTGYPKGSCGAAMDPTPLVLEGDLSVDEARERVRAFDGEPGDCAFLVDGERRLAAVVALPALLRAGPEEPLAGLALPAEHWLSAYASLAAARGHPGWQSFHVLPVLERERRLVGLLHRRALGAEDGPARQRPAAAYALGGLAHGYWEALSAITQAAMHTLPPVSRIGAAKEER